MKTTFSAATAAAISALALSGCVDTDDGPRVTQDRSTASFSRVANHDDVHVRLRVGTAREPAVRVRAGREVIDAVSTEVRDGTLHVRFEHDGIGDSDVVLEAAIPRLVAVDASGSGDVVASGVRAEAFVVRSDGSGDVELAGRADRLAVRADGSGDVELADFAAREVAVVADGSGDVEVGAGERLDVRLDGSGDVRYRGRPRITQIDDGAGELSGG